MFNVKNNFNFIFKISLFRKLIKKNKIIKRFFFIFENEQILINYLSK